MLVNIQNINSVSLNPFGMLMPNRSASSGDYRYGFGGQEMDNEINGVTGSSYTAEFWQYDARLGRRWNVDPITYPWQSSYAAFNNNPIFFNGPLGLEGEPKDGDAVTGGDKFIGSDGGTLDEFVVDGGAAPPTVDEVMTNGSLDWVDNNSIARRDNTIPYKGGGLNAGASKSTGCKICWDWHLAFKYGIDVRYNTGGPVVQDNRPKVPDAMWLDLGAMLDLLAISEKAKDKARSLGKLPKPNLLKKIEAEYIQEVVDYIAAYAHRANTVPSIDDIESQYKVYVQGWDSSYVHGGGTTHLRSKNPNYSVEPNSDYPGRSPGDTLFVSP